MPITEGSSPGMLVSRPMNRETVSSLSYTSPNVKKFRLPSVSATSRIALPNTSGVFPARYLSVSTRNPSMS